MQYYLDAFRNYANFTGRARRQQFWMFALFNTIITIVLWFFAIGPLFSGSNAVEDIFTPGYFVYMAYTLAAFIPSLAISVRRLHDIGKSGWYYLVILIPLAGVIWLLVMMCTDSQQEENKWGVSPKYGGFTASDDTAIDSIGTELE